MLNDTLKTGCQTKWKFIIILLCMAALAVGTALLLEHGQRLGYYGHRLCLEGDWRPMETAVPLDGGAVDGMLYLLTEQGLVQMDEEGCLHLLLEETGDRALAEGGGLVYYKRGGQSLQIYSALGEADLVISGGVDGVIPGENAFGVITQGSGQVTRTVLYDYTGMPLGRVDEKDAAMVRGAFLGDALAGLCYGAGGRWSLKLWGPEGTLRAEKPLEAEICYDMLAVGNALVLHAQDEICFLDESMETGEHVLLGTMEVLFWAGGDDFLAVVLRHQGEYYLKTFSPRGEILGETKLPMEIRDLEISGNSVCLIDFENLRVYDAFCNCYGVSPDGARAVCLVSAPGGLWLLGDTEAMFLDS